MWVARTTCPSISQKLPKKKFATLFKSTWMELWKSLVSFYLWCLPSKHFCHPFRMVLMFFVGKMDLYWTLVLSRVLSHLLCSQPIAVPKHSWQLGVKPSLMKTKRKGLPFSISTHFTLWVPWFKTSKRSWRIQVSNMSKIRSPSASTPTAKVWVNSVLSRIGLSCGSNGRPYSSTPYWAHSIMDYFVGTFVPIDTAMTFTHRTWSPG